MLQLKLVDREAISKRKFRVCADTINSVGGIILPKLFQQLGVEYEILNGECTGDFAHNPEPLEKNLHGIMDRMRQGGFDLGIVVDPDVDRLAFICEDGTMFGEEYTLVSVADYVLSHPPGNTVSNLSSTRALRDVTKRHLSLEPLWPRRPRRHRPLPVVTRTERLHGQRTALHLPRLPDSQESHRPHPRDRC